MTASPTSKSSSPGPGGTPVVAIVGWKNSGKTTLTVRLVAELVRRGWRVATVKHAHHAFQIDDAETDSARHRRAGAHAVAIVSPERVATIRELGGAPEPDLAQVLALLGPADVILIEGYKSHPIPKIEARREAAHSRERLADHDPHVIAIAADHSTDAAGRPHFSLDDIGPLADLIERDVMQKVASAKE